MPDQRCHRPGAQDKPGALQHWQWKANASQQLCGPGPRSDDHLIRRDGAAIGPHAADCTTTLHQPGGTQTEPQCRSLSGRRLQQSLRQGRGIRRPLLRKEQRPERVNDFETSGF